MKSKISIFIFLLTFFYNLNFAENFKIVFVAQTWTAADNNWLDAIINDWGATGVCIGVKWGYLDNDTSPGVDNWTSLDNALAAVSAKGLDIYVRVSMGILKPDWVTTSYPYYFDQNDFQIKYDGNMFDAGSSLPNDRRYPLNFVSSDSKSRMTDFYDDVLDHLNTSGYTIKEVVPTFSADDESEYPYATMCGYSSHEISAFKFYLMLKYNSIDALNEKWDSNFSQPQDDLEWNDLSINIGSYGWQNNSGYTYPNGRVDWMDFRTKQLAKFVNELNTLTNSYGFEMGLQLGCIYDDNIERRGWVDPTRLLEKVNSVHVADIYQIAENFPFGADYLRSICKFWNYQRSLGSNPIRFSTETNWDLYNYEDDGLLQGYSETDWRSFLKIKWAEQLENYYDRGAHEVYLVGWGELPGDINTLTTQNSSWASTVKSYSDDPVVTTLLNYNHAIHLGCEKVLHYNHNAKSTNDRFAIYDSITAQSPYSSATYANYYYNDDIITNYMIEKNPEYIDQYSTLYFTRLSQYITEKAYLGLMKNSVGSAFQNGTHFLDDSHGELAYTQGIKNEYNEIRSPIHLIWRSRSDLQTTYPNAGLSDNFISWAVNSGTGYYNAALREYPMWHVVDGSGIYNFDWRIREAWDENNNDQQTTYPDGYYTNPVSSSNMITWANSNIYGGHWPYIGDATLNKITNSYPDNNVIPDDFNLSQNYPNPFNPTTVINYSLPEKGFTTLKVYDILGCEVASLVNNIQNPGNYSVTFDASCLSSGVYIYTLSSRNTHLTKKLLLLK